MRALGIGIALFTGINTEFFIQRGAGGIVSYILLIIVATLLATKRRKNER